MHKLTIFERLVHLTKNSKARYSNFLAASILIDKNGNEWEGTNVEYVIPTNGICAERNALTSAFASGKFDFGDLKEIHIFAQKNKNPDKNIFVSPCGVCRQAIFEASKGKAKVFLYNLEGNQKEYSIDELLPLAFSGDEI